MLKLLTALLLCVGVANAADTPIGVAYRSFEGGLNNDDASVSIAATESPDLMNVQIDEPAGALTQRNGYQTCGTIPSGNTATNLYEYSKNDGSKNLIVTDNVTIWQTSDCVAYSTITTGLSALDLPRFATVRDNLWIVNGSTWPLVWNGSTLSRLDGSTASIPTGPKGKYITYWKSRVWIANVPTSPSSVYFSALVDDLGNELDPVTSTGAWQATNQIYINRDDGSPIYAIKPYRDNLYVGKETGFSRIVFESEYNLSVAKNVTTIGTKFNESVVEMDDGFLRFVGRDGIYAFDGSTVKRLSSKIYQTFKKLKQPSYGEQYKIWDTATDFIAGSLSNTSTAYADGSISLSLSSTTSLYDDFTDGNYTAAPVWTFAGANNDFLVTTAKLNYKNTLAAPHSGRLYAPYPATRYAYGTQKFDYQKSWLFSGNRDNVGELRYWWYATTTDPATATGYYFETKLGGGGNIYTNIFKSIAGVKTQLYTHNTTAFGTSSGTVTASFDENGFVVYVPSIGSISITDSSVDRTTTGYNIIDCADYSWTGLETWITNIYISSGGFTSTGTFTSQVSTATGITQWRTFSAEDTLNSQTIAYYARTGTTAAAVLTAPWVSITDGAIVSTTTDGYAQWKADLATSNNSVTPLLDSASIGWATGDNSISIIKGINYESRYWLVGSTTTGNDYNDLTIVASKSPLNSFTIYDLPLSALTLWNGNLYGAIGNTGKIARLDYGSTDDGNAIVSYWNSRDEIYENPIFYKTINTGILDYSNTPANTGLVVSLSPDEGATWQNRSVNLSASTLSRNTKKLNYNANTSLGFRTKVSNNVLGVGFKIYGIHNFGTQTGFYGK